MPAMIAGIEIINKILPIIEPTVVIANSAVGSFTKLVINENPFIKPIPTNNNNESYVIKRIDKIVKCLLLSIRQIPFRVERYTNLH